MKDEEHHSRFVRVTTTESIIIIYEISILIFKAKQIRHCLRLILKYIFISNEEL